MKNLGDTNPLPVQFGTKEIGLRSNDQQIKRLLKMLKEFAGFKFTSSLENKIHRVLRNIGVEELNRWLYSVEYEGKSDELIALIEDLTNHETFFFRDESQLEMISESILPSFFRSWKPGRKYKYRMWSSACSSGEEAYTLAMLFVDYAINNGFASRNLETGIKFQDGLELEVVGTDISRQAIRRANDRVYMKGGLASFRNMPTQYWKYFNKIEKNRASIDRHHSVEFFEPVNFISERVKFFQHNLMNEYSNQFGRFDLVLCRNMMIYIDPEKQKVIRNNLYHSQLKGSHLVVSAVDKAPSAKLYNESRYRNAIAYQRKSV